jgi:hypothetical protein
MMNPSEVEPSLDNGFLCGSCDRPKDDVFVLQTEVSFAQIALISGSTTERDRTKPTDAELKHQGGASYGLEMIFLCPLCRTTQELVGRYSIRTEMGEGVKRVAPRGERFVHYLSNERQLCIECATEYATEHLMDACSLQRCMVSYCREC